MSGLETAIRTALEGADRDNPEARARIYQSARQALETGLRKQDITDPQTVAGHRHRLEEVIHKIEAEERARLHPPRPSPPPPSEVPVPPEVEIPEPSSRRASPSEVSLGGETRHTPYQPDVDDDASLDGVSARGADLDIAPTAEARPTQAKAKPSADFRPERAVVTRKPRKFFSRLLLWCLVLAFIGIGAWWVKTSGLLLSPSQRDTSVANPPATTAPEDYDGDENTAGGPPTGTSIDPQNNFSQDWISVFQASDSGKLIKGSSLQTQPVSEAEGPAIRLISRSSDKDGSAGIPIPADILDKLQGKSSTIAVTLQASTDKPTQITVECDFKSLGDCARHRFRVTRQKQDVLLQVRFDRSATPGNAGTLFINSDVDGDQNGIDLYSVRILPGE
ncbi:hypothetical protein [Oryzifoliimicrobium ureilyticus]|uniref:hypothetical protein n=1 Tax=Oryzifoliimicrobium ureilyticus TaxID=3113724 RepID=UPI0030767D3E